jgi:hypothetical protein
MYESMLITINYSIQFIYYIIDINIPTSFVHQYATNSSSSTIRSHNTQQPVYVSLESNLPYQIENVFPTAKSIIPSFQRKFPFVSVAILGFFELISGLIVLALELIIFDITFGLWCGGIYALAGAAIIVLGLFNRKFISKSSLIFFLVIGTDRERHQISAVLIFQLVGKKIYSPCFFSNFIFF